MIFYGLHKNGLWYITSELPVNQSYIVIHADSRLDAECQLFEMINTKELA